jgi:hypothetical protein
VEFGGARIAQLTVTDQQVTTLPIHLPRLWQEMCTDNSYQIKDGDFTIGTTNS